MIVGVPIERQRGERRVAVVPALLPNYRKLGLDVIVEAGAGEHAGFRDAEYSEHGARICATRSELLSDADVVLQVRSPARLGTEALGELREGQVHVGLLDPLGNPDAARSLAETGVTSFALELLPRVTRAQPMDALTSMATVSGYKAVLLAAAELDKMCPLMMTAAGTATPAHLFIIGAGVAGLQAIATGRRLGAVVKAYDVRPRVREEVESLGASFVALDLSSEESETAGGYAEKMDETFYTRQRDLMGQTVEGSDMVITTAAIPGERAPILITGDMVKRMRPGAVVVDLAAESGGNCELTRAGESIDVGGVMVIGAVDVPSSVARAASEMYARNVLSFLGNMVVDGEFEPDLEDEIVRETLLTHAHEVMNRKVRERLELPSDVQIEERSWPWKRSSQP